MAIDRDLEFEKFQNIQEKLKAVFAKEYVHVDAEQLAFLVAQSIRDVPKLLRLLEDSENHSNDKILDAVHDVVANHLALTEANRMLLSAES
jgi:hypothetical protein